MDAAVGSLDTHGELSLDFSRVREAVRQRYDGPVLLLDPEIVRAKVRRFTAAMPRVRPHFAVKANPHPVLLNVLSEERAGFEVASVGELDLLVSLGVRAAEILFSNPIKSRGAIEHAAAACVKWYAIDSVEELAKVVAVKPDAKLYLRIATPNMGAEWPLTAKFGAGRHEARAIVALAAERGAQLVGVTFHVGSQCCNPESWRIGIEGAQRVFAEMRVSGLEPRLLNIGGGFPVCYTRPVPSIEAIGEVVNEAIRDLPPGVEVVAEPGRFLVSDAAYLVCRVTGSTTRDGKRWMYWDAGLFGGIIETAAGMIYEVRTDRSGPAIPWVVAGPTCDSSDVLTGTHLLPQDMQEGDFIYIPNAGAYTSTRATTFNGFPLPELRVI